MSAYVPSYLQGMQAYLSNHNVSGMYGMWNSPTPGDVNGPLGPGVPGEGGVDLDSPVGTPVYALGGGTVIAQGYWNDTGHGVVTIRTNVPGYGLNDMYYQHIIIDPSIQTGQSIQPKQQIGTVGQYGETEIGFNANWGGVWGTNHPAGWVNDPRPLIEALMLNIDNPGTTLDTTSTVNITLKEFITSVVNQLRNSAGQTNTLGQGPSNNIINFMISWAHQEGGSQTNACKFNIMNTMQEEAGSIQCQGAMPGIQSYQDSTTGEKALTDALSNGSYPSLLNALSTNDENNLGFNGHNIASNIAGDLSMWSTGKRSPINQQYVSSIVSNSHKDQSQIDQWGNAVIGTGTATDNNPLDALNSIGQFFGQLGNFFSNPTRIIKILLGAVLLIAGLYLMIKELLPSSVRQAANTLRKA